MSETGSVLVLLGDPRLASYATGDVPVWLWSADATRILWGNPIAAAIFNAPSSRSLTGHTIDPKGTAALQIARLAGSLPYGTAPRLERLRGFGGRMGGALMCACSRIVLADRTPAILVVATEAAGPPLALEEQAQRLLVGYDDAAALFAPDGTLMYATAAAKEKLGSITSLAALGATAMAATAFASGHAERADGTMSLDRIGTEAATLLLASFEAVEPKAEVSSGVYEPGPAAPIDGTVAELTDTSHELAETHTELVETAASSTSSAVLEQPPAHQVDNAMPAPAETQRATARALAERHQPLRFVWQMDADGRFKLGTDEFAALIGPSTAAALNQTWDNIAKTLALDPDGHVARAFASQNTWSGITVSFPVDGSDIRLPVEMSGLPVFDRDRNFRGYRGFGICRAVGRIAELAIAGASAAPRDERPSEPPVFRDEPPVFAPAAVNVVPFRTPTANIPPAPAEEPPTLTPVERHAFTELATRLSARLRGSKDRPDSLEPDLPLADGHADPSSERAAPRATSTDQRPILDRLPIGVLVYRLDQLIYANRAFLDWTGYPDLYSLQNAGGLDALFVEPSGEDPGDGGTQSLSIATNLGDKLPVAARLFSSPWEGESALVLMLAGVAPADQTKPVREAPAKTEPVAAPEPPPAAAAPDPAIEERQKALETALHVAHAEVQDARSLLDVAADGLIVLDRDANVIWANRGAQQLFGFSSREITGIPFATLFAAESQAAARETLKHSDEPTLAGRDVIGRNGAGGLVPLFMTASPIKEGDDRICAIFRDMTPWKKAEGELLNAKRQAERASSAKSDFLAKISHEIRTPLNAIIGFTEVMMQERFGPIGNDRYRQYLKDIHTSGDHLLSLLNDLLDLSKIEAGKIELNFTSVDLNDLIQESVALVQPQANRERIIIRTSLGAAVPAVSADARSVRQILLNLLSNSIKFTGAGGQVIVSTALGDDSHVVLRVRDTGIGMSEQDLAVALEPFRQVATSGRGGSGGTGLGLPLTKALAEANRASFKIKSAVNTGTLVEVAFPAPRMAAE